jgi:hypothetical protein
MTIADGGVRVETHVDGAGRLEIVLPALANQDVVVNVAVRPKMTRATTREAYLAFIESVFGRGNDPTFVAPPDHPAEMVEPL